MNKETYERMSLVITEFDTEDVITTSGVTPGPGPGGGEPAFGPASDWEMPALL